MKKLFTLLIFLLLWAGSSWGQSATLNSTPEKKVKRVNSTHLPNPVNPLGPLQGGETIATATVIPSLPYNDTGTTAGYIDDYDEICPYTGSTAPDVVYSYAPASNVTVDIDLCGSSYDTKVFVYENTVTPGSPFACNDDYYTGPPCGNWVSKIVGASLVGGNTYYIVVDGYSSIDYGAYAITVTAFISPFLTATPSSLAFGYSPVGTPTASQTYVLSGINLTAGPIVVAAPSGFEVSSNGSIWVASFNISYTPPTLPNTTVWVRFNPPAGNTAYSGNVTNIGGSASANVAVTGSSILPPPNDDCVNATIVAGPFPQTVNGTTLNATADCPDLLDWNAVWYAVTLPYALNEMTVDWCGTANMNTVGIVYYTTCPVVCEDFMLATSYSWNICGTPPDAYTSYASFLGIPGPATIYYLAYSVPQMDHVLTFNVTEVLCLSPVNLTADGITQTSANLTWSPVGTETAWEYVYGPSPLPVPSGSGTATFSSTVNPISPLLPGSTYQFYVRAACGGGIFSDWSGPATFTTLCYPITTYPWTEGFENEGVIPDCWSQAYVSGSVNWIFATGGHLGYPATAHNGTYNGRFYSSDYSGNTTILISPELDLSGVTNPVLSFWHTQANWGGDQDVLRVYYRTSAGGTWTLIPGQEYLNDIPAWTEESGIALPDPSATYFIGFEGYASYGYGVCVDDVTIGEESACPIPIEIVALSLNSTSAVLGWTETGSAHAWNTEVGLPGFTPGTNTEVLGELGTQDNPWTASPLSPATLYDFYVQADCGFSDPKVDHFTIGINEFSILEPLLSGGGPIDDPYEDGIWREYTTPEMNWYNIWFYNDTLDLTHMKKIRMGFWIQTLNPLIPVGQLFYVVNWSTPAWPGPGYPMPSDEAFIERSPTNGPLPITPVPQWIELYYIIPDYNPEWVSVDIWGTNITILQQVTPPPANSPLLSWWEQYPAPGGIIVHECIPKPDPNSSGWSGPYPFTTYCVSSTLPVCESFFDINWPECWTEQLSGGITSSHWSMVNFNNAGGTPYEAEANWFPGEGFYPADNDRMVSPPFNTAGLTSIRLSFRQMFNDFNTGINNVWIKVQSSSDGMTWTDEWSWAGGLGNLIAPEEKIIDIANNLGGSTWIAWTLSGYTYNMNFWYIDDICIRKLCTWTGNVSAAWNDPGNWTCGSVPDQSFSVVIPSSPSSGIFPVIATGVTAECFDITVESPGTLTIQDGGTLHVIIP